MPNVQVRDVPDSVHEILVARAARAGQSLQQYLSAQLTTIAATPSLDELLDAIDAHATARLSAPNAVAALDAERARR